jgi:hypothetical protein
MSPKKFFKHDDLTHGFQGNQFLDIFRQKAAHPGPRFQDACHQISQHSPEASRLHVEYLETIGEPRVIRQEEGMVFMDTDVHSSDSELGDVLNLE